MDARKLKADVNKLLEFFNKRTGSMDSLKFILEYTLNQDNTSINIEESLSYLTKDLTPILISYIASDNTIEESDSDFQHLLDELNNIKAMYSLPLKKHIDKTSNNPFLLSSASINIEDNSNYHKIRLSRVDGKSLDALFTTASMLGIISIFSNVTVQSLHKGIFNLDSRLIDHYIEESNKLIDNLENLKKHADKFKEK
ncbi:MAG TPA: hypothetical protein VIG73_08430 [Cerasibacillus sp.]|uniref:hypothetical protein n=1 Tax=Cerasibacillus sp. TaxID=2498711 RepID=UPI002F420D6D